MASSSEKAEFYRVYGPIVEEQCKGTGLYPEVILAQLALESDYGTKPAAHGNLGGRKVSQSQISNLEKGVDYDVRKTHEKFSTKEEADAYAKQQKDLGYKVYGRTKKQGDEFVVYVDQPFEISGNGSPEDNVRGQIEFLEKNPRYRRNGVFEADNPEDQAKALKRAGYATDAKYAEKLVSVYSQEDFPQYTTSNNLTLQDYKDYYDTDNVTIDGDEVVVDFGDGNILREPITKVDDAINAERQIESQGGTVGVSDQTESGQDVPVSQPPVFTPDEDVVPQPETDTEIDGMSNEVATPQDVEESDYVVDQIEAQRVFGPTARLQNINGKDVILYTDNEGVERQVDADTVTQQTPDYVTPSPVPPPAPPIVTEVQEEVPDATRTPEIPEVELQEDSEREIPETEEELRRRTMERQQELEEETQVEETEEVEEEVVEEVEEGVVNEVEEEEVVVEEEVEEEVVEEQVSTSSLSLEEVQEIYGPNATIGNVNGEEVIIVTGAAEDGSEDQQYLMSDAIAQRDERIAAENELIEQNNADVLGMRRRDFRNMTEEELNQRLEETNLSDEEKDNIRTNWTSANEDSILENLFKSFGKGDGNALEKASKLLKASGGISSLVAGFVGAKAAKKGMETVEVPEIEGLSTAFKQYSQQQKALSETGLSYAETQTIKQGIDEAYKLGIDNLVRGTGGDRAKFLAGTGALDSNRQTSLLKLAALEDEARRQNREAYGKVLSFEANYNKEKDIFTKSREYNQKLADKAMFQNTASSAFQHVFDNIRFGQDYAPILDQMQKTVNQLGNVSNLLGSFNVETNNDTEQGDPNDPNNSQY